MLTKTMNVLEIDNFTYVDAPVLGVSYGVSNQLLLARLKLWSRPNFIGWSMLAVAQFVLTSEKEH